MWPIKSQLKSRRIKFDTPQNQISWAFMKELRENNRTRAIYDINPYVEVYQFRDNLYGLFAENCDGKGDVWMYLTVGPERAMLIDTAYGPGDLKGLVDEITGGKPILVVKVYRDNVKRLVDRMHEYDYLFPAHFMNNIENNLMPNILETCDAVLANPEDCDYKIEKWGKDRGQGPSVRYYKFIKGFSVLAYGYNNV
jgi:hypothetical protein